VLGSVPAVLTALSICFSDRGQHCNGPGDTEPELMTCQGAPCQQFDILWNVGLPRTMPVILLLH